MEVMLLTQRLIQDLRKQIITGQLVPGKKINEIQISKDLDISRSPLREALKILENEHLVVNLPRKGSFVTPLSIEDFLELYQAREMIELYSIDLMKQKGHIDLTELASSFKASRKLAMPSVNDTPEKKLAYLHKVGDYHVKLVATADNKKLIRFYDTIYSNVLRYQFLYAYTTGFNFSGEKAHKDVMESLNKRKWGEAKRYLRAHIDFFAEQMKGKIKEEKSLKKQDKRLLARM